MNEGNEEPFVFTADSRNSEDNEEEKKVGLENTFKRANKLKIWS